MISIHDTQLESLVLWACSGPGYLSIIYENIAIANYCAAIGGVTVAALLFDRLFHNQKGWALLIASGLLLIHPAWTVSATSGDCGFTKRDWSYWLTGVFITLLVGRYLLPKFRRKQDSSPAAISTD